MVMASGAGPGVTTDPIFKHRAAIGTTLKIVVVQYRNGNLSVGVAHFRRFAKISRQDTNPASIIALDTRHTRSSRIAQMANVGPNKENAVAISPSSTNKLVNKIWSGESGLPVP